MQKIMIGENVVKALMELVVTSTHQRPFRDVLAILQEAETALRALQNPPEVSSSAAPALTAEEAAKAIADMAPN